MSVTDEIRARLDIVQFIASYGIPLKKAGRNYIAPCPFHGERTPSFVVFPDSQGWHCFGACATGGDIFNFVMRREGMDFVTALRTLAEKAGVQLPERSREQARHDERLDKLRGLVEEAVKFFHETLKTSAAANFAREYIRKRGLSSKTVEQFKIGYAPEGWQDTLDRLLPIGYASQDLIDAGLAIQSEESNRLYDRFRNRLMIPICDERGRTIGFGARALNPDDNPKYLNSPQGELFDKSATLFGLHLARRTIRESETAVIVEGYMDAIQAHQGGFTNVVAQMGTALTKPQLKQLRKYARRVILALDPDAAGAKATMRGLDVVRQASESKRVFAGIFDLRDTLSESSKFDLEIQVVALPEGQDPDDLIRSYPQAWESLIKSAQPVADYLIATATAHITPESTLAEREQVARELLPLLIATEDSLAQFDSLQKLAYKLRLGSGYDLSKWARPSIPASPIALKPRDNPPAKGTGRELSPETPRQFEAKRPGLVVEEYCLTVLLRYPDRMYDINRKLREIALKAKKGSAALGPLCLDDFTSAECQAIYDTLQGALSQDNQDVLEYLDERLPAEMKALVEQLLIAPLEAFEQRLAGQLRPDLNGILRSMPQTAVTLQSEREPLAKTVEYGVLLRRIRLKREIAELLTLQQDATDPELDHAYGCQVSINRAALFAIDDSLKWTEARKLVKN